MEGKSLKGKKTANKPNILFIDFKSAYDSLDQNNLFRKHKARGYSDGIVGSIKQIYKYMKANGKNIGKGVL
jgi:hypothetical protein